MVGVSVFPNAIDNLPINYPDGHILLPDEVNNPNAAIIAVENAVFSHITTNLNVAKPTGVVATDTLIFSTGLVAGSTYQLQPGTYIINPTTISTANVRFVGAPNNQTIVQLAGQSGGANVSMITINANGISFDHIVFDGNGTTIGSGVYYSGLITVNGGISDISFTYCTVQNTARSGIYAFGYSTFVYRVIVDHCTFTNIGTAGANTGGACVMFDGGCIDCKLTSNYAFSPLSSNFTKIKNGDPYGSVATGAAHTVITGSTASVIQVAAATYGINTLIGKELTWVTGGQIGQNRTIISNTASSITVAPAFGAVPAIGDTFNLWANCRGTLIKDNTLNYSGSTPASFDSIAAALAIEMFNGAWESRCISNRVLGPPVATIADQTVIAGSTSTVINVTAASLVANAWIGYRVTFKSGVLNGQSQIISANGTGSVTVGSAFTAAPGVGDVFSIVTPFWAISCGDARYSSVMNNTVIGVPQFPQAIGYGIETGECPALTVQGNSIHYVDVGMNCTNNNPMPSHSQSIIGNIFDTCYTSGIVTDSGPAGIKIIGNSFIDCGTKYIFLNSFNRVTRAILIEGNTFQIRDQTRLDSGGAIFGIYILGAARTDVTPVEIIGNYFGPFPMTPAGAGNVGILAIEINNPQGVRIINNHFDGLAPNGTNSGDRAINGDAYGMYVKGNFARNYNSGSFGYADANQPSWWEDNDIGTLTIGNVPTAAALAANGTTPPAPIVAAGSSPKAGRVTFGSGTAVGLAAGGQIAITFPYRMMLNNQAAPFIVCHAMNDATAVLIPFAITPTLSGFTISFHTAPAASQGNTVYDVAWMAVVS